MRAPLNITDCLKNVGVANVGGGTSELPIGSATKFSEFRDDSGNTRLVNGYVEIVNDGFYSITFYLYPGVDPNHRPKLYIYVNGELVSTAYKYNTNKLVCELTISYADELKAGDVITVAHSSNPYYAYGPRDYGTIIKLR